MLKSCFKVQSVPVCSSVALLILRLIVGVAFLYHGYGKIIAPFSWMPPDSPVPGFFQFLAALSEFGGGVCLIIGLVVPLAMLGLAFTMAVATYMHAVVMGDPFVNMTGGSSYELALVYFAISLVFFAIGPGTFSLDRIIFGSKK
ncbi:MAG: DoxX family protein [Oligoflexia bacterium]|nr:DoxX family protein [Oligoflexia bacterium]